MEGEEKRQPRYNNVVKRGFFARLQKPRQEWSELLDRRIFTNVPDEELGDNRIETSKYNLASFFPLNLIQQFSKLSNIYFLFIGILQIIPVISLSGGKPTIFLPLFLVVVVSMVKDFVENLKCRKSDQAENESEVEFLSSVGFVTRKWQSIRVGDIIRVKKDHYFPCDAILLDHHRAQKTAFVETKNLDGETNLKLKKTCDNLDFLRELSEYDLYSLQVEFAFEKPNPFLSTFNGNLTIRNKKYSVDSSNVVLRGCSLKISQWAVAVCVYTGHQTKILLNAGKKKTKVSALQKALGTYFRYIFLFQLSVTLLSAVAFGILYSSEEDNLGYIGVSGSIAANVFFTWGSWFISFSNFIPISLVVTVEMVRYGQGILLAKDPLCSSKGQAAEVQTSSINEELGQIKYIMTDKTGTLTQNLMDFKCLYVHHRSYGSFHPVGAEQPLASGGPQLRFLSERIPNVDFAETEKEKLVEQIVSQSEHGRHIRQCLLHLSLCHNAVPEKSNYTSSSPDELALVNFAKFTGYEFVQKNDFNELEVLERVGGQERILKYRLLHTLEFSSDRKRMSVIVEEIAEENSRILLLSKGADQVILSRLVKDSSSQAKEKEVIMKALYGYACEGLRTLVLAQRELSPSEYELWNKKYSQALTIVGPSRLEAVDALQSDIERELCIVGATAIEDKLQSEVKETIQELKKSNIKVWMLTGDKKETAISIGFSCGLISKDSERIVLDCDAEHAKPLLGNLTSMLHLVHTEKVTILSGEFIKKIDAEAKQMLNALLSQSESVICCRVSPKDKEEITKMVKQWGITLAIGDGANDVNMINSADVGVGVRGIEGSQATRAADFVITEFKLLRRLVTYHGLNFYHRNANVMVYTLYKNMLVTLPNLLYGPISMESGTYIYDIWSIQFFNIVYVSFPIIYYGLFDILYSWKELRQKPNYYTEGQQSSFFNRKLLVKQLIETLVAGTFLVYTVFYSTEAQISGKGYIVYLQWSGNLVLAIVVVSCNLRVLLMSHQFNIVQGILIFVGILSYYSFTFFISIILENEIKNTLEHQLSSGTYWFILFFSCFILEGYYILSNTLYNMNLAISKASNPSSLQSDGVGKAQELQLADIRFKKQLDVENDSIHEREEIGGYAFAEDQNRMALNTQQSCYKERKERNVL